jgi:thiol-disulfide isomerase/thioredoxin
MARTPSNMIPLGTRFKAFNLPDTITGNYFSSDKLKEARASVIMFICNHCPFVKHVNAGILDLARDYMDKGVMFVAISSNDAVQFPEDAPGKMKETAIRLGYPFPYLYDEKQEIAKAYDAACTPDFYVFDAHQELAYRGQLDDSRPSLPIPVTGADIRNALDNLLAGKPVSALQRPSLGCNIKWKSE